MLRSRLPSLLRPVASSSLRPAFLSRSVQTTADSSSLIANHDSSDKVKVQLHEEYFKSHLCDTPELEMEVGKEQLVQIYQQMVSMRRMEMAADQVSLSIYGMMDTLTDSLALPSYSSTKLLVVVFFPILTLSLLQV